MGRGVPSEGVGGFLGVRIFWPCVAHTRAGYLIPRRKSRSCLNNAGDSSGITIVSRPTDPPSNEMGSWRRKRVIYIESRGPAYYRAKINLAEMRNDKRTRRSFPSRWKSFPFEVGNFGTVHMSERTNEWGNAADFYRVDYCCCCCCCCCYYSHRHVERG